MTGERASLLYHHCIDKQGYNGVLKVLARKYCGHAL